MKSSCLFKTAFYTEFTIRTICLMEKRHQFNQMQNNYEQAPPPPLPTGGEEVLLCGFSSLGGRLTLCARHVWYSVGTHFLLALWQACESVRRCLRRFVFLRGVGQKSRPAPVSTGGGGPVGLRHRVKKKLGAISREWLCIDPWRSVTRLEVMIRGAPSWLTRRGLRV